MKNALFLPESVMHNDMKLAEVAEILDARVICGGEKMENEVEFGFASDLMSDVLTLDTSNMLLVTGLSNVQTIRTAEMAEIVPIVFVRNKTITPEMKAIAEENGMVLLASPRSMFRAIAILAQHGLKAIY